MSVLAELETRTTEPPFRPIAHIGSSETGVVLCGAEILGIKAVEPFDLCPRCLELNHGWDPRDLAAEFAPTSSD